MALPQPGEYITCKCGRCNDITGHVVMLVLDGEISKVECKACGSVHKYRESRAAKSGVAQQPSVRRVRAGQSREEARDVRPKAAPPKSSARPSTGKSAAKRSSAAKLESAWQEAMVRHSIETPLPYAMGNTYAAHDFLDHPVFGRGEVLQIVPPDKMDVLFQEGVKTLRCKA